jgi:hypothetical protein
VLRLIVSAKGLRGPANRRLIFLVCDQQTPETNTGADQAKGSMKVSPLGETD